MIFCFSRNVLNSAPSAPRYPPYFRNSIVTCRKDIVETNTILYKKSWSDHVEWPFLNGITCKLAEGNCPIFYPPGVKWSNLLWLTRIQTNIYSVSRITEYDNGNVCCTLLTYLWLIGYEPHLFWQFISYYLAEATKRTTEENGVSFAELHVSPHCLGYIL